MSESTPNPPPGFDDLPIEARIEYVQFLWDRIAASAHDVPVPQWHSDMLKRRLRELEADPSIAVPWPEARDRIRGRLTSDLDD
jgi:putative addiction module component (TIGR02574 family)